MASLMGSSPSQKYPDPIIRNAAVLEQQGVLVHCPIWAYFKRAFLTPWHGQRRQVTGAERESSGVDLITVTPAAQVSMTSYISGETRVCLHLDHGVVACRCKHCGVPWMPGD